MLGIAYLLYVVGRMLAALAWKLIGPLVRHRRVA
jgi:hypothetical protein